MSTIAAADEPAPRPNIVLCMTDDQGWGDVSYNGLTAIKTPNLDAMASGGIRFDRFYAQQECAPTRASVLTGRHPNRMGVFWPGERLRRQEITIAQVVKPAGYATGHFGKWHLQGGFGSGRIIPNDDPCSPLNVGFDESFSVSNYFEIDWTFGHNGVPVETTGDGSDVIVARALKFIGEAADRETPFLALVWFGSPHVPLRPLPADLEAAGGSAYYGELLAVDRAMGTLRRGLRELGVADNTLLWFCSDNGAVKNVKKKLIHGSNGGLRGGKRQVWEGGIRVPCVLEWPARITEPMTTSVATGVVDIYPTIVDILRVEVPGQVGPIDGISLLPLLQGRMNSRPKPIGFWFYDDVRPGIVDTDSGPSAWSDNQYKLVKTAPDTWELYDLIEDREETADIADKHPRVVGRMKRELEAWQQSVIRSYQGNDYPEGKAIESRKD